VALSANGRWAVSAGADATVRLWRLADGKAVGVFRKHGAPVVRAAFAANGRQTVSGDRAGNTLIWDVERFLGKPVAR
jgi:WD40 repeat protein